jgi:molybdopterin-binding protein
LSEAAKRSTKCSKHKKEFELWCQTDEQLICLMCHSHGEHKGHISVPLEDFKVTARNQLKGNLTTIAEVSTRINAIEAIEMRRNRVILVLFSPLTLFHVAQMRRNGVSRN